MQRNGGPAPQRNAQRAEPGGGTRTGEGGRGASRVGGSARAELDLRPTSTGEAHMKIRRGSAALAAVALLLLNQHASAQKTAPSDADDAEEATPPAKAASSTDAPKKATR